ncbi:hypothetical protein BDV98DRAFT_575813 [Pterulicium gracile]|uniref:Uncharacterized protein n=1 Tax=Pterulicium gracile TaxID=1884261 RepID=A0A5C3Q3H2_9AGAR|nr:hypothetical protein BDV98DRAFT_575813 [Pterula gracilis]
MCQKSSEDSPPFSNTTQSQDRSISFPGSSPLSPSTNTEDRCPATFYSTTYSSPNGSPGDDSDSYLPNPDSPVDPLPEVHVSTGRCDVPLRGVEAESITPTTVACPEKQGSGDTITIGQSPRPFHASNALGLMLESRASSTAQASDLDGSGEAPPDQDPAPIPISRPFAEFLQSLNGHQFTVEADPDSFGGWDALRVVLGPFVVAVLLIGPL